MKIMNFFFIQELEEIKKVLFTDLLNIWMVDETQ